MDCNTIASGFFNSNGHEFSIIKVLVNDQAMFWLIESGSSVVIVNLC
jgi:hypothetical protein